GVCANPWPRLLVQSLLLACLGRVEGGYAWRVGPSTAAGAGPHRAHRLTGRLPRGADGQLGDVWDSSRAPRDLFAPGRAVAPPGGLLMAYRPGKPSRPRRLPTAQVLAQFPPSVHATLLRALWERPGCLLCGQPPATVALFEPDDPAHWGFPADHRA